jgi:hypothetical protein
VPPVAFSVTVVVPLTVALAAGAVKLTASALVVNVAVTEVAALSVIGHVLAVPQPAPDQPAKVEPAAGAAVRVTTVPGA